jgi:hypothetical protein
MRFIKSIITAISFLLSLFLGVGTLISIGIGGKFPKSNIWVFGTLSFFFGMVFWLSIKWRKGK